MGKTKCIKYILKLFLDDVLFSIAIDMFSDPTFADVDMKQFHIDRSSIIEDIPCEGHFCKP